MNLLASPGGLCFEEARFNMDIITIIVIILWRASVIVYNYYFCLQQGQIVIKNFLEEVRAVDWNKLSEEEGKSEIEELRFKVLNSNNSYVNEVLKSKS